MAEPYIGDIRMFGGNFAPRGYALCNGQLLAISDNTALFQLLGTTYGGDGQSTFGLPDLRGRLPVHQGQGPGLGNYVIGQAAGTETVTLITTQIPGHTHTPAAGGAANATTPAGGMPGTTVGGKEMYAAAGATTPTALATQTVALNGGSQPHENMMPFLAINFIIALEGVFPSQN